MAPGGLLHGSPSASSAPLRGLLRLPGRGNLRREISQLYKTSCLRRPGSSRRDKFHILGFVRSRAVGVKKPPPPQDFAGGGGGSPAPGRLPALLAEALVCGAGGGRGGTQRARLCLPKTQIQPRMEQEGFGGADLRGQHQEGDKRGARGDPGKGRAGFEVQTGPRRCRGSSSLRLPEFSPKTGTFWLPQERCHEQSSQQSEDLPVAIERGRRWWFQAFLPSSAPGGSNSVLFRVTSPL